MSVPRRTSGQLKYQDAAKLIEMYEDAIQQGRILPTDDQGAFTFLQALRSRLRVEDYRIEAEKLRVVLEDKGQQVVLQYLAGESAPQRREDFFRGTAYFEAALWLVPA